MTDMTPRLACLGDDLERAARRDLRPRRRRRRHIAIAAAAAAIVLPGAAVAGIELISADEVATSLPAGTLALAGTEPDCTVVRANVEYHCVLERRPGTDDSTPTYDVIKAGERGCPARESKLGKAPGKRYCIRLGDGQRAPLVTDWKGTVEPTVDATKHVNGGCRSLNSEGTEWRCYIGEEAVRQGIIGAGFLGAYAPAPGVG